MGSGLADCQEDCDEATIRRFGRQRAPQLTESDAAPCTLPLDWIPGAGIGVARFPRFPTRFSDIGDIVYAELGRSLLSCVSRGATEHAAAMSRRAVQLLPAGRLTSARGS